MKEQLKTGRSVWQKYLAGETRASIARELSIPRNEVQSIIKYTTSYMYLERSQLEKEHIKKINAKVQQGQEIIKKKNDLIKKLNEKLSE